MPRTPHRDTRACTGVGQEAEGARRKHAPEPFLWFPQKGQGDAARAGLELAGMNYFNGLWYSLHA